MRCSMPAVGIAFRIKYKISPEYLHKTFWLGKDRHSLDYNKEVKETWKRGRMPVVIIYDESGALPI